MEAQVDWYEAYVDVDGKCTKLQVFEMRSKARGGAYNRGFDLAAVSFPTVDTLRWVPVLRAKPGALSGSLHWRSGGRRYDDQHPSINCGNHSTRGMADPKAHGG